MKEQLLELLNSKGVKAFNQWREKNFSVKIDLSYTDFSGRELDEINLSDAMLTGCNFSNASLIGAVFSQSVLTNSDFSNSDCRLAWFEGATASDVNFKNADLFKALMRFGYYDNADFTKANLKNTDFRAAMVKGAVFKGAKTKGSQFLEVDLSDIPLIRGQLAGALIPRKYRKTQIIVSLTKYVILMVNFLAFLIIGYMIFDMNRAAVKVYGNPGKTIGSYMNYSIGNMYLSTERPEKAIPYFELALKQKEEPIYYYRLSQAYYDLDDFDKAEEYYNRFEEIKPEGTKVEQLKVLLDEERKKTKIQTP